MADRRARQEDNTNISIIYELVTNWNRSSNTIFKFADDTFGSEK